MLDRHVTIGGRYFDVLQGTCVIEPTPGGVRLHLTSNLRVSTHFNPYAGPWADAIMRSQDLQPTYVLDSLVE